MSSQKSNFLQLVTDLLSTQEFYDVSMRSIPISELLRLPSVRKWISTKTFIESNLDEGLVELLEDARSLSRRNTIQHNVNSLKQNLKLDRGAILTDRTMQFINPIDAPHLRVLHIGPRNINEILASMSNGVRIENISALDLIQVYDFFDSGDIHQMPYKDSEFDVIVVGWVLAESALPSTAIQEITRVAKDGAIVGVGWDFSWFNYEDSVLLYDRTGVTTIRDSRDILDLFNTHTNFKNKVVLVDDSAYPWDEEMRKNTLVLKILKSQLNLRQILLRESLIFKRLINLITDIPTDVSKQLLGHSEFLLNYTQSPFSAEPREDYLLLRKNFLKYSGKLDEIISQEISKEFPPYFQKSSTGRSVFSNQELSEVEFQAISEDLTNEGFAMLPRLIPNDCLGELQEIFEGFQLDSGRLDIEEESLLRHKIISMLVLDRTFLVIAEQFLKSVPIIDFIVGMRTAKNRESGDSALIHKLNSDAMFFHFDKDRLKFLKIFIYLRDTDESNGAHELIPGSHKVKYPRDGRYADHEARELTGKAAKQIVGRAGTVFAVDTHVLHKGTPVERGYRDVLQFEYVNSLVGAPVKPLPLSLFLPESKEIIDLFPRMFMRYHK